MANGAKASLLKTHPEYEFWLGIFPEGSVEVLSFTPVIADSPLGREEFYRVDVKQLSDEQLSRIAAKMAESFRISENEVLMEILGKHGLPIQARFWSVAIPLTKFV